MKQAHHHLASRFARSLSLAPPASSLVLAFLAASAQARFGYDADVAGEYGYVARLRTPAGASAAACTGIWPTARAKAAAPSSRSRSPALPNDAPRRRGRYSHLPKSRT